MTGHVTVIWSASVERPGEEFASADELLHAIERDDQQVDECRLRASRHRPLVTSHPQLQPAPPLALVRSPRRFCTPQPRFLKAAPS